MSIRTNGGALATRQDWFPSLFQPFFEPWKELLDMPYGTVRTLPSVNVLEDKDHYEISLAAPGLKKEDFKVKVEGDELCVEAETSSKKEQKEESYSRREYNFTSFSRTFQLPDSVRSDQIQANYVDGELRISLPKKEEAKEVPAKTIAIH